MPHIIIEHSIDIDLSKVNTTLLEIQKITASIKAGNFDLEACKARAISFDRYFVGSKNEKESSFFHITIKIMAGRSREIKQELAQKVAEFVQNFIGGEKNSQKRLDISVDIIDMDRDSYQKITL